MKQEIRINFAVLEDVSRIWNKGNKERYYLTERSIDPCLSAYISRERDKGRYEIELSNGFLYLEKCYNDLNKRIEEIVEMLKVNNCMAYEPNKN